MPKADPLATQKNDVTILTGLANALEKGTLPMQIAQLLLGDDETILAFLRLYVEGKITEGEVAAMVMRTQQIAVVDSGSSVFSAANGPEPVAKAPSDVKRETSIAPVPVVGQGNEESTLKQMPAPGSSGFTDCAFVDERPLTDSQRLAKELFGKHFVSPHAFMWATGFTLQFTEDMLTHLGKLPWTAEELRREAKEISDDFQCLLFPLHPEVTLQYLHGVTKEIGQMPDFFGESGWWLQQAFADEQLDLSWCLLKTVPLFIRPSELPGWRRARALEVTLMRFLQVRHAIPSRVHELVCQTGDQSSVRIHCERGVAFERGEEPGGFLTLQVFSRFS